MASVTLIKTCLNMLHFSGVNALTRRYLQGRGIIFCLHHILPHSENRPAFAPNANLETTPEFLSEMIKHVRGRGYETLSLADALATLKFPQKPKKPFAVFTLDDGYKDNQIYAQPVFNRLACPYTVFVAPGIVEGKTELWWKALEAIILKSNSVSVEIAGRRYSCNTQNVREKNLAWQVIYPALRDAPEHHQRAVIRAMAAKHGLDLETLCKGLAMNWSEIKTLAQDPLCTIGAHTMNHLLMAKLDAAEAKMEMQQSADIIVSKIDKPVEFFAYPYGDEGAAGARDFALARGVGFKASVTTRKGVVYEGHQNHMQALPRIMVSSRYDNLRYIDALISGAPTLLLNTFKQLNVN